LPVVETSDAGVTVEEARRTLLAGLPAPSGEEVPLVDALSRVLIAPVSAATDLPRADNSSMDGYAVACADLTAASPTSPVVLPRGGEARAGRPRLSHGAGTATLIATGALLPAGADAVVRVEEVVVRASSIAFAAPVAPGTFVRRRGEDVRAGAVMVEAGRRLRSVDIGACAAAGADRVVVARRPRVALLSTGDELVAPGTIPEPHQVTDVSSSMLAAAVREAGGIPVLIGAVPDDRAATTRALEHARDGADLIVSTAGVSMGEHDHVRACVAALGSVDLWKVAMRPGRPLVVGTVGATPFLGLPGNPVSSAVTFLLFARPAILAMQGAGELLPPRLAAALADPMQKPAHLETYVRVRLHTVDGRTVARSSGGQGSNIMQALGAADALAILPAGGADFPAGTVVEVMLIP
jgi:molybdopterin molybdotransferase